MFAFRLASACVFASLLSVATFAQTPVVADGGVLNGASFAKGQPVAPGSIVSIFGSELASSLAAADSIPLSTSLNSVSVSFNGIAAPLYFVSATQVNAQLPWNVLPSGATSGMADLVVTRGQTKSATQKVTVGAYAPGIFAVSGTAIAINADGTLAAPPNAIPGLTTHPAKPGDILLLLGTGFGATDLPVDNGAAPPPNKLATTLISPTVLIGGVSAQVLFSGLAPQFPGVNQLNIKVPDAATVGNTVPLQIQMPDGSMTSSQVTIAITK